MTRTAPQGPPHDLEAELAVVGSVLLKPDVIDDLAVQLDPSDFYDSENATLYHVMTEMHQAGQRIDITLLVDQLRKRGELESIGGAATIARAAQAVPHAAHAKYYARIIREKAILRDLEQAGYSLAEIAHQATDPHEALAAAESIVMRIGERHARQGFLTDAETLMRDAMDRIDRRVRGEVDDTLPTGFVDLDRILGGGFRAGELNVVAGRPSMGKSAYATNIFADVAIRQQKPALLISLEIERGRTLRPDNQRAGRRASEQHFGR